MKKMFLTVMVLAASVLAGCENDNKKNDPKDPQEQQQEQQGQKVSGTENGHDYVDMGEAGQWAT